MLNLLKKIACLHSWKSHAKEKYEWTEVVKVKGTEYWDSPRLKEQEYSSITEVLICEKCGKIKKIEY